MLLLLVYLRVGAGHGKEAGNTTTEVETDEHWSHWSLY